MRPSDTAPDPLEQALARAGTREAARRRQEAAFEEIAGAATSVVIAGCGYLGRLAYAGAKAAGLEVAAFADNNPLLWGTQIDGLPVLNPADAVSRHDRAFFVVAIYNGTPVRQQLGQLGCRRVVPYPLFFWEFWRSMPEEDRLELPDRILSSEDDIRAAYQRLSDRRSREEFAAQIAWRCSLDYDCLSRPDASGDMYFARDIVRLTGQEVLIDCGAFDGDSIRMFLDKTEGAFRAHLCARTGLREPRQIEPVCVIASPRSRATASSSCRLAPATARESSRFEPSGTAGSRIVERSDDVIECRRLDDLLEDVTPTYIKMDIEGAEPRALRGATEHHPPNAAGPRRLRVSQMRAPVDASGNHQHGAAGISDPPATVRGGVLGNRLLRRSARAPRGLAGLMSPTPITIPAEVRWIAAERLGAFFESVSGIDRHILAADFLNADKCEKRAELLERYIGLRSRRVLEVGSGFGTNLVAWSKRWGIDGYGVEPGSVGFDSAVHASRLLLDANGLDPNRIINARGEELPFEDESFDVVYSANVLEHTQEPERVISESLRVLRRGGVLQMEMPNFLWYFEGHYMILQPPIFARWMLPLWVRLRGRDPAFARTLNTWINPNWCRSVAGRMRARYDIPCCRLVTTCFSSVCPRRSRSRLQSWAANWARCSP